MGVCLWIMGSLIEINDMLKFKCGEELLGGLEIGVIFFFVKEGWWFYYFSLIWVFLVEEVEGKWNFIG